MTALMIFLGTAASGLALPPCLWLGCQIVDRLEKLRLDRMMARKQTQKAGNKDE